MREERLNLLLCKIFIKMKGEVEASLLGIYSKMYVIKVIRIRNIFSNLHKRKETACMHTQLLYLLGVTKPIIHHLKNWKTFIKI